MLQIFPKIYDQMSVYDTKNLQQFLWDQKLTQGKNYVFEVT